jgi:hypothetical protein
LHVEESATEADIVHRIMGLQVTEDVTPPTAADPDTDQDASEAAETRQLAEDDRPEGEPQNDDPPAADAVLDDRPRGEDDGAPQSDETDERATLEALRRQISYASPTPGPTIQLCGYYPDDHILEVRYLSVADTTDDQDSEVVWVTEDGSSDELFYWSP